jgi:hypothetical protein
MDKVVDQDDFDYDEDGEPVIEGKEVVILG